MSDYRIYILDPTGHIYLRYDFVGRDDLAAFDESKKYSVKQSVEIWQGTRQVARIDPDGQAATGRQVGRLVREV
jgi:hypothetical protein